jgi:YbbR domain-containing protein
VANRLLRWASNNWALKLAALALALLLWMAVRAGTPRTATFRNIPVQVDLRDPDWRLADEPEPRAVHVTVQGPTSELMALATQPPRIVLPVERVNDPAETQVVPLQWVQLPRGVRQARVVALRPDTILLRYEPVVTRTLPVGVRLRGDLSDGYSLTLPVTAQPAMVQVRGPARRLAELDTVPLVPVDISGLRSTTNVPARVDSTELEGLRFTPPEVNVVLRVVPAAPEPEPEPVDAPEPRRRLRS